MLFSYRDVKQRDVRTLHSSHLKLPDPVGHPNARLPLLPVLRAANSESLGEVVAVAEVNVHM